MTLTEILALPPDQLRREMYDLWKDRGNYRYLSYGAMLLRIKKERLWKTWGHKGYFVYVIKELELVAPHAANLWTGAARMLLELGFTLDDLEVLEKKIPSLRFMSLTLSMAQSKGHLFEIWESTKYKEVPKHVLLGQMPTKGRALWPRAPFPVLLAEISLIEDVIEFIRQKYGAEQGKAIVIMALVFRALVQEGGPDKAVKWLKPQLRKFNLPEEIADLDLRVVSDARFKRRERIRGIGAKLLEIKRVGKIDKTIRDD